jgi:hypothetical protein
MGKDLREDMRRGSVTRFPREDRISYELYAI